MLNYDKPIKKCVIIEYGSRNTFTFVIRKLNTMKEILRILILGIKTGFGIDYSEYIPDTEEPILVAE